MRATPVIAAAFAVLSLAGSASAAVFVGVNEDAPKLQPSLYQAIADANLQQNVLMRLIGEHPGGPVIVSGAERDAIRASGAPPLAR